MKTEDILDLCTRAATEKGKLLRWALWLFYFAVKDQVNETLQAAIAETEERLAAKNMALTEADKKLAIAKKNTPPMPHPQTRERLVVMVLPTEHSPVITPVRMQEQSHRACVDLLIMEGFKCVKGLLGLPNARYLWLDLLRVLRDDDLVERVLIPTPPGTKEKYRICYRLSKNINVEHIVELMELTEDVDKEWIDRVVKGSTTITQKRITSYFAVPAKGTPQL